MPPPPLPSPPAASRAALAVALDAFLAGRPPSGVYDEPTTFEAFIDHGSNPELYRRTIEIVRGVHAVEQPATVLDIGCGDGRVTAAVLAAATERVDLVEPSATLLALAAGAVAARHAVVPHTQTLAEFAATVEADTRWALAQSTFALHTTHPDDRPALLSWLTEPRVERLLVVEFDVPAFADRSPEHLAYLADRYEVGVREYAEHPEAIDGFLMPVLVGQLDPFAAPLHVRAAGRRVVPAARRCRVHDHAATRVRLLVGRRQPHRGPPGTKLTWAETGAALGTAQRGERRRAERTDYAMTLVIARPVSHPSVVVATV